MIDNQSRPGAHLSTFTRVILLISFYFVGGIAGKEASFLSGSVALVWPPAGIALAAVLLFGYRFWPGVAFGAVLFSMMNGMPFGFFTTGTAIGNTVGAIVCVFLIRSAVRSEFSLERTRDVTVYIVLACLLGTTVNAAFNLVGLAYSGKTSWDGLFLTMLEWWVPNALAGLVITPLIVAWARPFSAQWNGRLMIEAVVCGVGLVVGTLTSFHSWFVYGIQNYPLAYLPFPFLVWGSLRFGPRGATTGTFLVSVLAIHSLLQGRGPFVTPMERDSLMLIGSYIGILAVTNLFLAAAAAERHRAELNVFESEKRFRGVVEDQTDLICRFRPDGTLTFVNGAYCRFYGKDRDELIGTNFMQKLSMVDAAVPLSSFRSLTPDHPVVTFDFRVTTPSDCVVWQQYAVRRLALETDEIEFQAVIQDITERKQSEQALRASEAKYRSLVAHIPDVVWTARENRELIYISDKVRSVLDYTPEELIQAGGSFWLSRVHPNDVPHVQMAYELLFAEGRKLDIEYRIRRKSGEWIWLHERAPGTRREDGVLCADGLCSDVSRRKRTEEGLQQARDDAESANRAKSLFLANMSHELRTPLNAIIGFSEILSDKTFGDLNDHQLKYTNNILSSGRHLLQLINDILDLSKVEAGRLQLSRTPFRVAKAMADVETIVKTLAAKKRIALKFKVAADLPSLFADEPKFKQIMYNLLSNAIKFTPDGGHVTVTTLLDQVSDTAFRTRSVAPVRCLRIAVADTGIGIQPEDHERIFREFEQVDSSYGRQQQGTGLGLALTKKLVELHGGNLQVQSRGIEGEGTTFTFTMPIVSPGGVNPPPASDGAAALSAGQSVAA
jgi:PAS domain S-box-containing protein